MLLAAYTLLIVFQGQPHIASPMTRQGAAGTALCWHAKTVKKEASIGCKCATVLEVGAARLQAGVARAQAHQLHILLHEPGHHRQHQVRALLEVQPAYEPYQRRLRGKPGQASCLAHHSQALGLAATWDPSPNRKCACCCKESSCGCAVWLPRDDASNWECQSQAGQYVGAARTSGRSGSPSSRCSAALLAALPRLKLLRP